MIYFIVGTKAQFIKMAPVVCAAEEKGIRYRIILTGQHRDTLSEIADNFNVRAADYVLYDGPDIVSIPKMFAWAIRVLWKTYWEKSSIFDGGDKAGVVLVHGDTFSTLLGAFMAKIAGLRVGHVESGLRSFNYFHPFPEEITRLIVFRISDFYFCPGSWAVSNLDKFNGVKIDTKKNTLFDALKFAVQNEKNVNVGVPQRPFGIVSLHRFENISSRENLLRVVEIVERIAESHYLLFILHKPTEKKLKKINLYERLRENENIEFRSRYDYFRFVKLIMHARFMVSDGGSNQEECSYLNKPLLLLRKATERPEGLDKNCVLSNYEFSKIDRFIQEFAYGAPVADFHPVDDVNPSEIILDACVRFSQGTENSGVLR